MAFRDRADATAEYLSNVHWTNEQPQERCYGRMRGVRVQEETKKHLAELKQKYELFEFNVENIDLEELGRIIRKMSRNKSPAPDQITTDFLKDLMANNRKKLLKRLNAW